MRYLTTLILRLYMDTEASKQLCGDLRALSQRKARSFTTDSELILLAHRLAMEEHNHLPLNDAQYENDLPTEEPHSLPDS